MPSASNIAKFKLFRNIYNTTIRAAKKHYFDTELKKTQKNLKQNWKILKEAIRSNKSKSNSVDFLIINGIGSSDPKLIAECFNLHFSTMAANVASKIEPTDKPPDAFCKKFDCSFISAHLPISLKELLDATNALQSKNSTVAASGVV